MTRTASAARGYRDWLLVACVLVVCLAEYCVLPADGARNPWLAMTGPWCPHTADNPVLGFAWAALDGDVASNENHSLLVDQAMLAGKEQNRAFYALRPGVGLIAFLLFWLDSVRAAALAVLGLGLLAVATTCAAARRCGASRPTATVLALIAWHLGAVAFHLHDLGAHIGGLAGWMTASCAVLAFRPWRASTSPAALVFLHAIMVIALLLYWANVAVYLAFVLVQWPRWRRLAAGLAVFAGAYGLRTVWPALINLVYWSRTDYAEIERSYLAAALAGWRALREQGRVVRQALVYLGEGIVAEPMTLMLMAVIVVTLVVRWTARGESPLRLVRDRRVVFIVLSMAIACAQYLVWAPSATVRGYLLYGVPAGMLLLVACVAGAGGHTGRARRALPACLLIPLVVQVGWAVALAFDNPVAVCQYLSGRHGAAQLPHAFVEGFRNPPRFLGLNGAGEAGGLRAFAATLRDGLAGLRGEVAARPLGPIAGYKGASRSLPLCALLLAPWVIAVVSGLRATGRAASPLARPAVAILAATYVWLAAWWLSPRFKQAGTEMLPLKVACAAETGMVDYPLTVTAAVRAGLHALDVERLEVRSGWQRINPSFQRRVLTSAGSDEPVTARADGTYGLAALDALADGQGAQGAQGAVLIHVREIFAAPPTGYIGWQRDAAARCGSPLAPYVELRGFRRGENAASVFVY